MQPSDLNSDGVVDVIDLSILVSRWGSSDVTADINSDGVVDALDLSTLVSNWGAVSSSFTALLVTADGTLNTGATALRNILSDEGYSVVVRALSEPEDYSGIDVVVLSYGNPTGGDNGTYVNPPVGVVGVDTWRPIGMASNLGFENNTNPVEVVDAASPLAAGVSGTFNAYVSPAYITWTTDLSASPDVVVTRPSQPTQAVVFGYEAGSTMPGRYATTRHVALGYHLNGFAVGMSSEARAQLLAAVAWARSGAYVAPPPPNAPTNLNATAGDMQVSLSWNSVAGATSYSVKRSTTSGGPYSTIVSGHTTTSYIDSSLTNGSTYYYVVSASNAEGESSNSTQASATPVEGGSGGGSNLALLVTSEEVAMWQDRAVNGPFKSSGDFSTNSPGHWDEMNAALSVDYTQYVWSGPELFDSDGSVAAQGTSDGNVPIEGTRRMHDMMSASYANFVVNNGSFPSHVMSVLNNQRQVSSLNFWDRSLWPYNKYNDLSPVFHLAQWMCYFIIAYDNALAQGATPNSAAVSWFEGFADFCENELHNSLGSASNAFPNRKSNDYSVRGSAVDDENYNVVTRATGEQVYIPRIMVFYNNRRHQQAGFLGLYGALTGDAYYIGEFKRYMRELVMFGASVSGGSRGSFGDWNRGTTTFPQLGYSYHGHGITHCLWAMDALARQGDTELYDFSSSEGSTLPNFGTNHYKTMEDVIDSYIKWGLQSWPNTCGFDTSSSSTYTNPYNWIQSRRTDSDREIVQDGNIMMAACYYGRTDWVDAIMRVGTPSSFTSSVNALGVLTGWRVDGRNRFLRSIDANPYT
jgi:hypothetical protein